MTASAMARACELIILLSAYEIKPAGVAYQLSDGAVEENFGKGATNEQGIGQHNGQVYILQASAATRSFVFPLRDNAVCERRRGMAC